jgi:hypothetical protein
VTNLFAGELLGELLAFGTHGLEEVSSGARSRFASTKAVCVVLTLQTAAVWVEGVVGHPSSSFRGIRVACDGQGGGSGYICSDGSRGWFLDPFAVIILGSRLAATFRLGMLAHFIEKTVVHRGERLTRFRICRSFHHLQR